MSTVQDIYISPRQIISYLVEFEKKLPKPHKDFYLPTLKQTPITDTDLNAEARRMMDFVGLSKYVPRCKFCTLEDGVGGNTRCCNDNIEVEINVSSKHRNNIDACVAVLAHEICHKYLYVYGLYNPIEVVNEIFTDLCTMYVGFGNIIMKGYITETRTQQRTDKYITTYTNTQYLGYLKFPIYQRTLRIIRLVMWDEDGASVLAAEQDPLLQDAFKEWATKQDKKTLSKDSIMKVGNGIAEMERNFYILRSIFRIITARYNCAFDEAEQKLYQEEWFDGERIAPNKRFTVFNGIYQSIILSSADEENLVLNEANRYMRTIIAHIADLSKFNQSIRMKSSDFTCPHCGTHHKSEKFTGRKALIKCPTCKRRFIVDCQDFDILAARNELDRYKDELIAPVRQGYIKSLTLEKKKSYEKGYSEAWKARGEETNRQLRQKISKMPFWLRWLIGKRLD